MHARALEIIQKLGLESHPEGGFFARVFLSSSIVVPNDSRSERRAFSSIYFLLTADSHSRWHRVVSDEAWHHYEGAPVELFQVEPTGGAVQRIILGPLSENSSPLHVVPAGYWQAARSAGAYSFVGCSVGPAFDYADFMLLRDVDLAVRPLITPSDLVQELL